MPILLSETTQLYFRTVAIVLFSSICAFVWAIVVNTSPSGSVLCSGIIKVVGVADLERDNCYIVIQGLSGCLQILSKLTERDLVRSYHVTESANCNIYVKRMGCCCMPCSSTHTQLSASTNEYLVSQAYSPALRHVRHGLQQ